MHFEHNLLDAFGQLRVSEKTPALQIKPTYNTKKFMLEKTTNGGTCTVSDYMWNCTSGSNANAKAQFLTKKEIIYRSGISSTALFTAKFTPATNTYCSAGLYNVTDELSFGYNNTDFCIFYKHHGLGECQKIICANISSAMYDVVLNGVTYQWPFVTGDAQRTAYNLANYVNTLATGWEADQVDDTVYIIADDSSVRNGSYSTTLTNAVMSQEVAGVAKTEQIIKQTDWNINTMSELDPTKGNVYKISYQYLGFGSIFFYIERADGKFQLVHEIKYTNNNTITSLANPNFQIGLLAFSSGTNSCTAQSSSVAAFLDGKNVLTANSIAVSNTITSSTTAGTNILSIKNNYQKNGYSNEIEVIPLVLSISNNAGKSVLINLILNGNFTTGTTDYQEVATDNITTVNKEANIVADGELIHSFSVAGHSSIIVDIKKLNFVFTRGETLAITSKLSSGSGADLTASLTYYEDR